MFVDSEVEVRPLQEVAPLMVIQMSNGKKIDHPASFKTQGGVEIPASPTAAPWSPSKSIAYSSGGPFPRSVPVPFKDMNYE